MPWGGPMPAASSSSSIRFATTLCGSYRSATWPAVSEGNMSMPERKNLKPIPKFESEDEEREFWATHDSTEHVDWSRAKPTTFSQPMAEGLAKLRRVEVELPEEAFRHRTWHPQEVAREM